LGNSRSYENHQISGSTLFESLEKAQTLAKAVEALLAPASKMEMFCGIKPTSMVFFYRISP
jgi:hypothetical protein